MPKSKILIVEDETAMLYALEAEFSHGGFKTIPALTGQEALNKLDKEQPSAVILDLLLPGEINGFEVLRQMKANPKTKNIPVIIISNLGDEANIKKGLEMGASGYLVKTEHSLETILEKVKKIVAKESAKK